MQTQQPFVTDAKGRRQFACAPIAVQGVLVNEAEQVLLLAHPKRQGTWEVVSGAWEAGETLGSLSHKNGSLGAWSNYIACGRIVSPSFSQTWIRWRE
jgi:hypothetical protein